MADINGSQISIGKEYFKNILSDILGDGLVEISQERPEDPIQYLVDYLRNLDQNNYKIILLDPIQEPTNETDTSGTHR